jgi:acylphosphatase
MALLAKTVRVTGRVQGVGFRAWSQTRAERLGLDGWVRNEPDGGVLALISGEARQVERMLDDLRDGPPGSAVTKVAAEDAEAPAERGFSIRR